MLGYALKTTEYSPQLVRAYFGEMKQHGVPFVQRMQFLSRVYGGRGGYTSEELYKIVTGKKKEHFYIYPFVKGAPPEVNRILQSTYRKHRAGLAPKVAAGKLNEKDAKATSAIAAWNKVKQMGYVKKTVPTPTWVKKGQYTMYGIVYEEAEPPISTRKEAKATARMQRVIQRKEAKAAARTQRVIQRKEAKATSRIRRVALRVEEKELRRKKRIESVAAKPPPINVREVRQAGRRKIRLAKTASIHQIAEARAKAIERATAARTQKIGARATSKAAKVTRGRSLGGLLKTRGGRIAILAGGTAAAIPILQQLQERWQQTQKVRTKKHYRFGLEAGKRVGRFVKQRPGITRLAAAGGAGYIIGRRRKKKKVRYQEFDPWVYGPTSAKWVKKMTRIGTVERTKRVAAKALAGAKTTSVSLGHQMLRQVPTAALAGLAGYLFSQLTERLQKRHSPYIPEIRPDIELMRPYEVVDFIVKYAAVTPPDILQRLLARGRSAAKRAKTGVERGLLWWLLGFISAELAARGITRKKQDVKVGFQRPLCYTRMGDLPKWGFHEVTPEGLKGQSFRDPAYRWMRSEHRRPLKRRLLRVGAAGVPAAALLGVALARRRQQNYTFHLAALAKTIPPATKALRKSRSARRTLRTVGRGAVKAAGVTGRGASKLLWPALIATSFWPQRRPKEEQRQQQFGLRTRAWRTMTGPLNRRAKGMIDWARKSAAVAQAQARTLKAQKASQKTIDRAKAQAVKWSLMADEVEGLARMKALRTRGAVLAAGATGAAIGTSRERKRIRAMI